MPLLKCLNGNGWKFGNDGKPFSGPMAKRKALKAGLTGLCKTVDDTVDNTNISFNVEITKNDPDRQIVFGWGNVSMVNGDLVVDSHGDTISPEELENAAYEFTLSYNDSAVGEMHTGEAKGKLIESFVVTPEKLEKMGLAPDALPIGWWLGMYVEDKDLFAKVKEGTYRSFSIQGLACREKGD